MKGLTREQNVVLGVFSRGVINDKTGKTAALPKHSYLLVLSQPTEADYVHHVGFVSPIKNPHEDFHRSGHHCSAMHRAKISHGTLSMVQMVYLHLKGYFICKFKFTHLHSFLFRGRIENKGPDTNYSYNH